MSLAFALSLALAANAQPYKDAVGVVFTPDFSGPCQFFEVQWKHFLNEKNNLDIRAGYQLKWGPQVSGTYNWYVPFGESRFAFYGGPGAHIGLVTDYNGQGKACVSFGLCGVASVEYAFAGAPIALSLEWHPYLTWQPAIDGTPTFGWAAFGLGVKYCF